MEFNMRLLLTTITLMMLAKSVFADTSNRAIQISPVPGVFVGGVGLFCSSDTKDEMFLLLTRDRNILGDARFDKDDVSYQRFALLRKTPNFLFYGDSETYIEIQRKTLRLETRNKEKNQSFNCADTNISNLHKAAENKLRELLEGNKI